MGEIETQLASYPQVKQAVALAKEHLDSNGLPTGNKYLVAYYVSNEPVDHEDLLVYLSLYLPEYMIPAVFVWLKKLPLTINGKLNHRALPDPEVKNLLGYVAPRNDLEHKVCEIYAKVLNLPIEYIGIRDNFFRLGGSSIFAIKLVNALNEELFIHNKITLMDIFKYKMIETLIDNLLKNEKNIIL